MSPITARVLRGGACLAAAVVTVAGLATVEGFQLIAQSVAWSPPGWCATPRVAEPLLADAKRHASSADFHSQLFRRMNSLPILLADNIVLVRDDEICRTAAIAYRDWHRPSVDVYGRLRPVLVAMVGDVYMVDDARERTGADAVWAVVMFDQAFRERPGHYGSGY